MVSESPELSRSDTEAKQGDIKKLFIKKGLSRGLSSSDTVCQDGKNGSCAWDRTKCLCLDPQGVEGSVSHDLAEVVKKWAHLSPSIRSAILAIVQSADLEGGKGGI